MRNNYWTNHKDKENNDDNSFSIYLSLLTDRQRAIFETIRTRLSPKDAILYLQERRIPLIDIESHKGLTKLKEPDLKRFYRITKVLLNDDGILLRIFEMAFNLMSMWIKHFYELNPIKQILILREIFPFQHYLSACFETVNDIISLYGSDFSKEYDFIN